MSVLPIARTQHESATTGFDEHDEPFVGLLPIELYTVWGREVGWIRSNGARTSDWLNRGDSLIVHGASDLALDAPTPALVPPEPDQPLAPVERLAADIVMVVPPALPANRHLRLHRRIEEVRMELASFGLLGRVHIRPGAVAGDYLMRSSRRFVPVTHAELSYTGSQPFVRQLPVVIVNVTHLILLDRTHAASAAAEAPGRHTGRRPDDPAEAPSGVEQGTMLSVRHALEQLAELADAKLITATEHRRKRTEILARL